MCIGISFSKEMDYDSVLSAFTISPSVNGLLDKISDDKTKFIFYPETTYSLGTVYTVTVDSNASDLNGMNLYKRSVYVFSNSDDYLNVDSIILDRTNTINDYNELQELTITNNQLQIVINFSRAIDESVLSSAMNMISLKLLFPSTSTNPVCIYSGWNLERNGISLIYDNITKKTSGVTTTYQLKISGGPSGINDGNGIYMEKNICINIQPQ